jgi:hypothetical protein
MNGSIAGTLRSLVSAVATLFTAMTLFSSFVFAGSPVAGGLPALEARVQALEAALTPPVTSATVNCASAESIQNAVDSGSPGVPLTITVIGTCIESVSISNGTVTIQGDSAGDGIEGRVFVLGAQRVVLDNLTITVPDNTPSQFWGVLAVDNASLTISNSSVQAINSGNVNDAVAMFRNSSMVLINTNVSGAVRGVNADGSSFVDIRSGSVIEDNTDIGVLISRGASGHVRDSTIQNNANIGILTSRGGTSAIERNTVSGHADFEIFTQENGFARLIDNTVTAGASSTGAVYVTRGSGTRLRGGNVIVKIGGGVALQVDKSSNLTQEFGTDQITGEVEVDFLSFAIFEDVEITGDIRVIQHSGLRFRNRSGTSGKTLLTGNISVSEDSYTKFVVFSGADQSFTIDGAVECLDDESSVGFAETLGTVTVTGGISPPAFC